MLPASVDATLAALAAHDYLADRHLATALFLALKLSRPLFLEGEPGTGKTEIAKTVAAMLNRPLIRLQCHEGLDLSSAAYEWNYARQMIEIRLADREGSSREALADELFSSRFLIRRALLQAIDPAQPVPPVLLIDEVDRADEAFEAYLLELLSDFQLSIPELGTVHATSRPLVVITSNGTRELSDALRRRCLYQYIDYPDYDKELAIVQLKAPQAAPALARQVVAFVQAVRRIELQKKPGIAETLDWTAALLRLGISVVERDGADRILETLGALIKTRDDRAAFPRDVVARLASAC